jgi:hypothetical protein
MASQIMATGAQARPSRAPALIRNSEKRAACAWLAEPA